MTCLKYFLSLFCLLLFLAGCTGKPEVVETQPVLSSTAISPTAFLPAPVVAKTKAPDPSLTARDFLEAYRARDYAGMYSLLDEASKSSLSEDTFTQLLESILNTADVRSIDYKLDELPDLQNYGEFSYRIVWNSGLFGALKDQSKMELALESGQWRVRWDPGLIFSHLRAGNKLLVNWDSTRYERAAVYDRDGQPLVAPAEAMAVGLWLSELPPESGRLYASLASLFNRRAESIQAQVEAAQASGDDYLAIGEISAEELAARAPGLDGFSGVQVSPYVGRFYFGSFAPHVIGYAGSIHREDLESYLLQGYSGDELVGQYGLEEWGDKTLAGQRGATLYVADPQGQPLVELAKVPSSPPQAIYTTLDQDLQRAAWAALDGFNGAAVVLERDTGRVLALVSSPSFDPNAFAPANFNSYDLLNGTLSNASRPLYNRAVQGQYPLGSVFKIITMAAALEKGGYTPASQYQCNYTFDELPGTTLYDWTWEHFQEDGETLPSGPLDLVGGLIRSCDPFFWHIGLDLHQRGLEGAVAEMARNFGFGNQTGIEGLPELPGVVPDPGSEMDATNLAVGQGDLQVTPLQVARMVAAVGNGGTLYRPQVIEKIAPAAGDPSFVFEPQNQGALPVNSENLKTIQQAMHGVVAGKNPRGTAYHIFNGLDLLLAGKTGTAQTGNAPPHAWFAGYTYMENPEKPDIAIAVIIEHIGEGSDYAAPIFRRLVEVYFLDRPGKLLPWEKTGGGGDITETPSEGDKPIYERNP